MRGALLERLDRARAEIKASDSSPLIARMTR
jgi:hypothetical protein